MCNTGVLWRIACNSSGMGFFRSSSGMRWLNYVIEKHAICILTNKNTISLISINTDSLLLASYGNVNVPYMNAS